MCDFGAKNNITISNVSQPQRLMSGSHTAGSQLRPRVESSSYGVEERRMRMDYNNSYAGKKYEYWTSAIPGIGTFDFLLRRSGFVLIPG